MYCEAVSMQDVLWGFETGKLSEGELPFAIDLAQLRFFYPQLWLQATLDKENILRWLGGDVNYISNWHEQYNLEIFKIGAELQVQVIDISTVFLSLRSLGDYYCNDGMHPNEAGHALIAEVVLASGLVATS